MIACISPAYSNYEETVNTLKYGKNWILIELIAFSLASNDNQKKANRANNRKRTKALRIQTNNIWSSKRNQYSEGLDT